MLRLFFRSGFGSAGEALLASLGDVEETMERCVRHFSPGPLGSWKYLVFDEAGHVVQEGDYDPPTLRYGPLTPPGPAPRRQFARSPSRRKKFSPPPRHRLA